MASRGWGQEGRVWLLKNMRFLLEMMKIYSETIERGWLYNSVHILQTTELYILKTGVICKLYLNSVIFKKRLCVHFFDINLSNFFF